MERLIKFCGVCFIAVIVIFMVDYGVDSFNQYLHKDDVHYTKGMLKGSNGVDYEKVTNDGRVIEESTLKFENSDDALRYYEMD